MFRLVGVAALTVALCGCWTSRRPEPPEPSATEPAPPPPAEPEGAPEAEPAETEEPELVSVDDPLTAVPSVVVTDTEGAAPARFGTLVDVTPRLEACGGGPGERVEVALVTEDGDILTRLRKSSAGDEVTSCVVRAIAQDVDTLVQPSWSPSERLPDVRSVLTVRFGQ